MHQDPVQLLEAFQEAYEEARELCCGSTIEAAAIEIITCQEDA